MSTPFRLIRDLVINAPAESELRNLVLTMETDPPFARPAIWHINSVPAGGSRRVVRCDTVLEATFLFQLAGSNKRLRYLYP